MWRPEEQLQFDQHQFANRGTKAVSADYRGHDEWNTPGISFGDLSGIHVTRRAVQQVRRLATPAWVMDDAKVRAVVLNFIEDRLYIGDRSGSDSDRIQRINNKIQATLPELVSLLEELQLRYRAEPKNQKSLAVEIQNVDSQIMLLRRGLLAVVVSVIYMYYREGLASVEVAEQLRIKSPMVRVWLFRLAEVERYLSDGTGPHFKPRPPKSPKPRKGYWSPERVQQLKAARESGKTWKQCAVIFNRTDVSLIRTWKIYLGALPTLTTLRVRPEKYRKRRVVWTPERIAELKNFREVAGLTFQECAAKMGLKKIPQVTRWAYARYVLGKKK